MSRLGKSCRMHERKTDRLSYITDLSSFALCLDLLKLTCTLHNYCSTGVNIPYPKTFKRTFLLVNLQFHTDIFAEKLITLEWRAPYLNKGHNVKFTSRMFVFDPWLNRNIMAKVKIYIRFNRVVRRPTQVFRVWVNQITLTSTYQISIVCFIVMFLNVSQLGTQNTFFESIKDRTLNSPVLP